MTSAAIDPPSSRGVLKRRTFESLATLAVIFLTSTLALSWVLSRYYAHFALYIVADVFAGLVAYYVYLLWNKQPIRIRCRGCGGVILWNTPWICGECGHENLDVARFPFLRRCGNPACRLEPKSYVCHHCERTIFLSEDRDPINPARRATDAGREAKRRADMRDRAEQARELKRQNLESKKLDVEDAQLEADLKAAKEGPQTSVRSECDIMFERLKRHMEWKTALNQAMRRMKELNKEQCKDPRERRRRDLEVDEWARNLFSESQ